MRAIGLIIILFSFNCSATESKLNHYRCGYSNIKYNMTESDVIKKCGKSYAPKQISRFGSIYYTVKDHGFKHYYDQRWSFQQYGRFRHYLYFNNGSVSLITEDRQIRD